MRQIEAIRELLTLPKDRFLSEQLRAAVRTGDEARQDALQMQIKDLFFERSGEMFELAKFPKLRSADEFASTKTLGLVRGRSERRSRPLDRINERLRG